jgi:hypothetical protein
VHQGDLPRAALADDRDELGGLDREAAAVQDALVAGVHGELRSLDRLAVEPRPVARAEVDELDVAILCASA